MAHPAGSANTDAIKSARPLISPQPGFPTLPFRFYDSSIARSMPRSGDEEPICFDFERISRHRDICIVATETCEGKPLDATLRVPMPSLRSQLRDARARRGAARMSCVPFIGPRATALVVRGQLRSALPFHIAGRATRLHI